MYNQLFKGNIQFNFNSLSRTLILQRYQKKIEYILIYTNYIFTITAEILARSLANFYRQYAPGQTHEFEIRATRQRARAGNSTICYRKKQIDVSF